MFSEMTFEEWLGEFSKENNSDQSANEPITPEDLDSHVFFYDGDDEDLMYRALLSQCTESERRMIEEVAGGDYWLAQSFLHDLNKD